MHSIEYKQEVRDLVPDMRMYGMCVCEWGGGGGGGGGDRTHVACI